MSPSTMLGRNSAPPTTVVTRIATTGIRAVPRNRASTAEASSAPSRA